IFEVIDDECVLDRGTISAQAEHGNAMRVTVVGRDFLPAAQFSLEHPGAIRRRGGCGGCERHHHNDNQNQKRDLSLLHVSAYLHTYSVSRGNAQLNITHARRVWISTVFTRHIRAPWPQPRATFD